jgi:hypothetical protein
MAPNGQESTKYFGHSSFAIQNVSRTPKGFVVQDVESPSEVVMPKKWKPIPPVPFELLKKGHEGVLAERELHGPGDPTIALVKTLADEHKPEDIMAVSYRLGALAKLIRDGEGEKWTITVLHKSYKLVNEALFRAAARAPLFEAATVGQVSFDPTIFLPIALEETQSDGNA